MAHRHKPVQVCDRKVPDIELGTFAGPCLTSKQQKREVPPCARCFARWLVSSGTADLPPQPPVVTPGVAQPPALGSAPAPLALAAEAALDWMETHGGEVRVSGPTANLSILADATAWSTRFLPTCGRLLPFLRRFGVSSGDLDVFKGIDLGKSD